MRHTNSTCPATFCSAYGFHEYGGLCAKHWAKLTPAERAAVRGEEPPVEKVIHTEHQTVRRVYSEGPWPIVVCLWVWRVVVSVALVRLWWKVGGW